MTHWTILTGLMVAFSGSESGEIKPEVLTPLHMVDLIPYVQVSSQWATMYSAVPMLVAMPVAVESATEGEAEEPEGDLLDPAGFSFDEEEDMLNDRPWNWGTAEIGPGVLFPQPSSNNRSRGGSPGSPSGGGGRSSPQVAGDTFIINPPGPGGDTPETPQVPEPMSAAIWLATLGATALWLPRKRQAQVASN